MKKLYESPELTVTLMNNSDNIALELSSGTSTGGTKGLYSTRANTAWGTLK